jgi:LPS sulfotransferase NodH
MARSDSNLLSNYLKNTGLVGVVGEYFNPNVVRAGWEGRKFSAREQVDLTSYIEFLRAAHAAPDGRWGAKLLYEDMEHLIDLSPMKAMLANARVIFLRRELKLPQAISYFLARETGKWVHSDVERKPPEEVAFDFRRIDAIIEMFSNQEAQWRTLFEYLEIRPLEIVYERLIEDTPMVLAEVMKFLGVEVVEFPIRTRMRRQTTSLSTEFRNRYLRERWGKSGTASVANYGGITFSMK